MLVDVVQADRPPSREDRRAVSQDAIAFVNLAARFSS
jgi:hypothetical protein